MPKRRPPSRSPNRARRSAGAKARAPKRKKAAKKSAVRRKSTTRRASTSKTSLRAPLRRKKRRRSNKKRAKATVFAPYGRAISELGVLFFTFLVGLSAVLVYVAKDLPDRRTLWRDDQPQQITLLARDGAPIPVHGVIAGSPVRLRDLPPYVPNAILAVEDRNFYHHFGVNPLSIVRALIINTKEGEVRQGGSTITQQLAKNVFLNHDRTLKRKVQELMLAFWLELQFTKEEILTLYLNRVYFGAGAYGLDAASHRYFAKSPSALNVGEAAVLAGLLKAPSRYAPTSNPVDAGKRGRLVIDQMVEAKFLSPEDRDAALADPIYLSGKLFSGASYFIDYLIRETHHHAKGVSGDLVVTTSLDPHMQASIEQGTLAGLALASAAPDVETAAVILDSDGAVRAMIGGRNYRKSQF